MSGFGAASSTNSGRTNEGCTKAGCANAKSANNASINVNVASPHPDKRIVVCARR